MLPFRKFFTVGCIEIFATVFATVSVLTSLLIMLPTMDATAASLTNTASSEIVTDETNAASQLPNWLLRLDLNATQVHQVFEIDALLERQLELILTGRQYSQWQSSQAMLSSESWTFEDLNIDLSSYQQVAVDASFQSAMQNLLNILSLEQKQQLMQYLSDENIIPESSLEI
ncbi:MAG: hypothetical protein ACFB16_26925 [Phormidesmis sp.]|mgnify:FL=1